MAERNTAAINDLPDSVFAYIETGGTKDQQGKTTPRSKRHFPVHDEAHTRTALAQAGGSPHGRPAMPKILTAARKFKINVTGDQRAAFGMDIDTSGFPERRFTKFPPEIRTQGEHGPTMIYGYAACYDKLSRKLGGFVEQVSRSAFITSKTEGWPDVVCRYNHKDDWLLGTTHARTLRLATDETGLVYEVQPPNARADVLEYVSRGDVRHSSFAFRVYPGGDEWGLSEFNYPMRTLLDVSLVDVAPVLDPAYPDATSGARALNGAIESLATWVQGDPEEVRSMLQTGRGVEFFKRVSADGGRRSQPAPVARPKPRTAMTGQQALLALQNNMTDPYTDEG
jgi:HK97 family phage prohead protease